MLYKMTDGYRFTFYDEGECLDTGFLETFQGSFKFSDILIKINGQNAEDFLSAITECWSGKNGSIEYLIKAKDSHLFLMSNDGTETVKGVVHGHVDVINIKEGCSVEEITCK